MAPIYHFQRQTRIGAENDQERRTELLVSVLCPNFSNLLKLESAIQRTSFARLLGEKLCGSRGDRFEPRMKDRRSWSEWWREFFGLFTDRDRYAAEILSDRYLEKTQYVARLNQQAERMQYPQFRKKLLEIAADERKHTEWLAEKIKILGGRLPDIQPVCESTKNSWQYLLEDLTGAQRSAPELLDQAQRLRGQFPDIAEILERIYRDGVKHREAIRDMLMKSDPQSLSSWLA
jgi:rubrerythrin